MRRWFWRWMDTWVGDFHTWVHFRYIKTLTPVPREMSEEERFYQGAQWTPDQIKLIESRKVGQAVVMRGKR